MHDRTDLFGTPEQARILQSRIVETNIVKPPDKPPAHPPEPSPTGWDEARRDRFAHSLRDMSGVASGWGRGAASLVLRAAGDALLASKPEAGLARLFYVSRPVTTEPALARQCAAEILAVAQPRNAALNITGALLSSPLWFAQVLEGESASVEALYASIARDPRHRDLRLLSLRPIGRRAFARWSMAHAGEAPAALIRRALDQWNRLGACDAALREWMVLLRGRLRGA
jgi:hypothetical protein